MFCLVFLLTIKISFSFSFSAISFSKSHKKPNQENPSIPIVQGDSSFVCTDYEKTFQGMEFLNVFESLFFVFC